MYLTRISLKVMLNSLKGYRKVYPSDLVMNYMLAWKGACGVSKYYGIVSPAYAVFRINPKYTDQRFIHHSLRSKHMHSIFKAHSKGIIDSRLRLYPDMFLSLGVTLPDLVVQKTIANFLDHKTALIDRLIEKKQKLIKLLEEYQQAIIHQAVTGRIDVRTGQPYPAYKPSGVEWLRDVPEHWPIAPVKRYYSIQLGKMLQPRPQDVGDRQVHYLKAKNIQWFDVDFADVGMMYAGNDEVIQFGVKPGDLLVCEGGEGGRCALMENMKIEPLIIQNALHRVRPLSNDDNMGTNDYLQYVMSAVSSTGWFNALSEKSTIAHFTAEKFKALAIPIPSLVEQKVITDFLDHRTALIDRLIEKKQKQIKLLEEYKQAIIHQAVTGQIDVRAGRPYPAYKSSGVEWLAEVPEHWEIRKLKFLAKVSSSNVDKTISDDEKPILLCNYTNVYYNDCIAPSLNFTKGSAKNEEIAQFQLKKGQVLITKDSESWDDIGIPALVAEDMPNVLCGYHLAIVEPLTELDGSFLAWLCRSKPFNDQFKLAAKGITRFGISQPAMKNPLVVLPPPPTQRRIARFLDNAIADISKVVDNTEHQIELLQEYRTRLITDAVTGKIDVREVEVGLQQENLSKYDDEACSPLSEHHSLNAQYSLEHGARS